MLSNKQSEVSPSLRVIRGRSRIPEFPPSLSLARRHPAVPAALPVNAGVCWCYSVGFVDNRGETVGLRKMCRMGR